jgi:hypothetical protein
MLRPLKIVWRGLSDSLENLLPFFLYSLAWWICVCSIVLAPGAAIAMAKATDPRVRSGFDRPTFREFLSDAVKEMGRGWRLTAITFPVLGLLALNLWYYGSRENGLAIMAPAWFVLLLIAIAITLTSYSVTGLLDLGTIPALKAGAIVTGARLGYAIVVFLVLALILIVGTVLVLPMLMLLPATAAAIVGRLALNGLRIEVFDPNAPTPERLEEAANEKAQKKGSRLRGRQQR